jgi:hypothetical protein
VTFDGQLIVGCTGGRVSLTVTGKLHSPPARLEQVTAVVPIGKKEPDGGLQSTGSVPQGPDVVGAE